MSEHVEGLPEALDDDDHSSASSESSGEEDVPPQRAVAAALQPGFLQDMSITNEFHSVSGLGAGSLEMGKFSQTRSLLTRQWVAMQSASTASIE